LPAGPVSTTTTKPGLLVAVALPRTRQSSGLVWRLARRYNAGVRAAGLGGRRRRKRRGRVQVVGKGDTSLVFALTRGDTSAKAVKVGDAQSPRELMLGILGAWLRAIRPSYRDAIR